jgi:PAS domain S-box-containing protein
MRPHEHCSNNMIERRRSSDDQFRWAVEAAPNAMILVGQDSRIFMVNRQAEQLFGYSRDELVGESIEKLVPERFRNRHEQERKAFFAEPQSRPMGRGRDLVGRRKDGSEVPVEIGLNSIVTPKGVFVLASIIDITERKRTEAALRERETHYSLLAETVPEILYTWSPDGHCDYVSQRYYTYTGRPPETAIGDGWIEALHPEDRTEIELRWREAVTQESPFDMEFRLRRHDGTYGWFRSHAVPVRDTEGHTVRWFGVAADIDEQKRTQEVLREIDRRKDEFFAMLGHELRNPLAPIRNAAHILRLKGPPDLQRLIEMIERQSRHLARLVDDLLDISRLLRGKITLKKQPVDLVALVRQVAEDNRSELALHGHQLNLDLPEHTVEVEGDDVRLTQIIDSLLENAVKYTPDGGQIEIAVRRADHEAAVSVHDNGIGITPEDLSRIFELFAQVHQELDRNQGGLGIGLALVQRLVKMHGGWIKARSEGLGRGSDFTVYLPLLSRGLQRPNSSSP